MPVTVRLTKAQRRNWRLYVNALRREVPCAFPVTVKTCRIPKGDDADCEYAGTGDDQHFVIRISSGISYHLRVDALIHEWAHCLDWSHRHDAGHDPHDETWGVCYSKTYQCRLRVIERIL